MSHHSPKINARGLSYLFKFRPVLRWVFKLGSSPQSIAAGLGLGMFVAFTPTIGIQIILAVIVATIFRVNKAAAIAPVWITNPVTAAPVYTFNYVIGALFVPGPPMSEVSHLLVNISKSMSKMQFWQMKEQFDMILHIGRSILIPLCLGSVIVGTVLGILTYLISLKLLIFVLKRRRQKHLLSKHR